LAIPAHKWEKKIKWDLMKEEIRCGVDSVKQPFLVDTEMNPHVL
jgi:hypothetical protein